MTLEHLKRYERPRDFADFAGFDRREYYVCFGEHRDSDTLTRSNFRVALKRLGGESETVLVIRDHHWAVGWIEAIYIHESDIARLAIADGMLEDIDGYPVLDEDDWSNLQYDEASAWWATLPIRDRVEICQRFRCNVFAARRDNLPDDPQGGLVDYLADGV